MAFVLSDKLVLLREGLNTKLKELIDNPDQQDDPILELAEIEDVETLTTTYNIELIWPWFRKWEGARRFRSGFEMEFSIMNEPWESSFEFDRDKAEDNKLRDKILKLGPKWARAYKALLASLTAKILINGQALLCYDKQFLFDTDHPIDDPTSSGSQQNYWSSGMPLTRANLQTVATAMVTRKVNVASDDLMAINPTELWVPPALETTANEIVNTVEIVDGSGNRLRNVMYQRYRVRMSPRLQAEPTAWYLRDPMFGKPVFVQDRKKVDVVARDQPRDSNVFYHRKLEIGADCRAGAGPGLWQGIAKAKA
jgi:phage major head subunit gpT-like protein